MSSFLLVELYFLKNRALDTKTAAQGHIGGGGGGGGLRKQALDNMLGFFFSFSALFK